LAKARLAVQQAEVALATARDDRVNLDEGADAATLTAAQADADKKRLAVADAEAALAGTKLTAPFAGTVLRTYVIAGNQIGANTRIVTVADMKVLQVAASVDETTIRRVSAGQSATITFDAFPGRSFRGKVVSVPLQGALQGGVMVYEVPVSLTGVEGLALLVGMTANVKVDLGQATNALLVPAMAVVRSSGTTQVLVPNALDAKAAPELVPVEVGLSDGVNTQIVKGLNLGDKVVVQMTSAQSNSFNFGAMFGGGGAPVQVQQGGAQQGNRQPNR
jgi:RND family efflux transporter MFP subunit